MKVTRSLSSHCSGKDNSGRSLEGGIISKTTEYDSTGALLETYGKVYSEKDLSNSLESALDIFRGLTERAIKMHIKNGVGSSQHIEAHTPFLNRIVRHPIAHSSLKSGIQDMIFCLMMFQYKEISHDEIYKISLNKLMSGHGTMNESFQHSDGTIHSLRRTIKKETKDTISYIKEMDNSDFPDIHFGEQKRVCPFTFVEGYKEQIKKMLEELETKYIPKYLEVSREEFSKGNIILPENVSDFETFCLGKG